MKIMKVTIPLNGAIKIEMSGFIGPECRLKSKGLMQAVGGKVISDEDNDGAYATVAVDTTIENG